MIDLDEMFDDAVDDATHAARQAFIDLLPELDPDQESALLHKINDAITAIMRDHI